VIFLYDDIVRTRTTKYNIDYILTSADRSVSKFEVLDPDINFSDHLPLLAIISCANLDRSDLLGNRVSNPEITASRPTQLRWDHGNNLYYHYTGCHLIPISDELDNVLSWFEFIDDAACDICSYIVSVYCSIVSVLNSAAKLCIPQRHKNFFKFWWDQELNTLKQVSEESNKLWILAGKPCQGHIFQKRQDYRMQYRKRIRDGQKASDVAYTNDLHEALLRKDGPTFGNVGDQNLNLLINVTRLTAALMAIKLLIRFESILASHTPVMMRLVLLL